LDAENGRTIVVKGMSMAAILPGWGELLTVVRRCERGEPLPEQDQQDALDLATSVGLATLTDIVGCSISLQRPDGGYATPAAAGEVAQILDDVQYAENDGPCLRAARTGRMERLNSIATDGRWPALARRAAETGVASSLSLPLLTSRAPAALNLYGSVERAFESARATAVAGVMARATSAILMDAGGLPIEGLSAARVQRAITERTLITRAQGVLMARDGLTANQAYRRLAVCSAEQSSSLHDVARRVLDEAEAAAGEDVSA
jgi:hypothetical protein